MNRANEGAAQGATWDWMTDADDRQLALQRGAKLTMAIFIDMHS
jgi:hypothetical protein